MFGQLETLGEKRQAIDALEAEWLQDVADYDRSEDWRADGFQSAASALRTECRLDAGVAHMYVNVARKLEKLPVVADAFRRGEISLRHASVVANAYTPERAAEISNLEAEFIDAALKCPPHELRGLVQYASDAIDGDGGAADDDTMYRRRRYHGSTTFAGMYAFDGIGDPETGEIHRKAIQAEMERDYQEGDTRTPGQRRYDALTNILRGVLDHGMLGSSRAVRPHITEVVHLDEYPGATPELIDLIRKQRSRNGRLSSATLERIRCDCDLTRVLMVGKSEILDVGRATRTVTPAQWKALVVRDGHCQAPGCRQPPERCQAHHLRHWGPPDRGPTDLANLELLCHFHHREKHIEEAKARARDVGCGKPTGRRIPPTRTNGPENAIASRQRAPNRS